MSQPVAKITIDLEPCLLEKLQKSDRSLGDCRLCLQHIFKAEPWLLRVSGSRDKGGCSKLASVFLERVVR